MHDLFFSSHGRIARPRFWLGFGLVSLFIFAGNSVLRFLGPESMAGFYIALFFPFLSLYMLYCVYGKRLHDTGRTVRPFFVMLILEVIAVIVVMMMFGGADYFAEFSQFDRKEAIDPAVTQEIIGRYQDKISANMPIIEPLLLAVPVIFTLWVGATRSDPSENAYGPPPLPLEM